MGHWAGIGIRAVAGPILLAVTALPAWGVSCLTQSQMSAAQRDGLRVAAMAIAGNVQAGDEAAVKVRTVATVASQFQAIAGTIEGLGTSLRGATLTVDELYLLDARDLNAASEADFFCGLPNSSLTVEVSIPDLPPGTYSLAVVHATGVTNPQAMGMVLENDPPGSGTWKLAGFFARPMTMGGHDGLWFWQHARQFAAKKDDWDAYFYFQTAAFLLDPVDFLTSPNLQKLERETEAVRPAGLPGAQPMHLTAGGQTFNITNLHTGELSGQLDLVVTYAAAPNQDPMAARAQVTAVMRALLAAHPEMAGAFHGLWVYARTPDNQHPFALELPIEQIQNSGSPAGQHS